MVSTRFEEKSLGTAYSEAPTTTVKMPSRMNYSKVRVSATRTSKQDIMLTIHLHPSSPPTPCIKLIPYARMPLNAPANAAAE